MKFYHPKVVDTSVLFRRKNGSKMKLKDLAGKILNVIYFSSIREKFNLLHMTPKKIVLRHYILCRQRLKVKSLSIFKSNIIF